jgi:cytochrome c oxidase subunit 3
MMWIFLVSDTFIFGSFLSAYMSVRLTTIEPWPNTSQVFALHVGGTDVPLLLIAIMTFILISSSGTMAMAVTSGYKKQRKKTAYLILLTALGGVAFVGMQMFEWSKLIFEEGIRPWGNEFGADQFGGFFFMITGFHGLHVSIGVVYLSIVAKRVLDGRYDRLNDYQMVEVAGLYWHFVDLVWIFIFAFFYLW